MSRSTFIFIVSLYSLALGLFVLFVPTLATDYFGGGATNLFLVSIFRFIGVLNAGLGIVGLLLLRQSDLEIRCTMESLRIKYNFTPCFSKSVCLILLFIFYGTRSFSQNPPISQYYFVSSPNSNGTQFYGYFDEKFGGGLFKKTYHYCHFYLGMTQIDYYQMEEILLIK
ncbi:hypothetical protein FHS57_005837 [Runella defluvii]|uniref:Uncharacterized protein n=1 Tax=Runella defluvii TaxID=370973 RepID=A0A7W5ZRL0_9BACT|nr:hypothetical protein [Runella defluvii]